MENKFNVGSWYKVDNFWFKFKELRNNKEFWGDYIVISSKIYYDDGWMDSNQYPPELIEDISEIQQYLPEGHPDKSNANSNYEIY